MANKLRLGLTHYYILGVKDCDTHGVQDDGLAVDASARGD